MLFSPNVISVYGFLLLVWNLECSQVKYNDLSYFFTFKYAMLSVY